MVVTDMTERADKRAGSSLEYHIVHFSDYYANSWLQSATPLCHIIVDVFHQLADKICVGGSVEPSGDKSKSIRILHHSPTEFNSIYH